MNTVNNCMNLWVCTLVVKLLSLTEMLISRKVTEVSEISHVNLMAGWTKLTKPINRSNSSLMQDAVPRQSSM